MKNWQITGVLTFLIIGTVLMSGCTSTGSTSAVPVATPTPKIVYVTVTVTPTWTTTPLPTQTPILSTNTQAIDPNGPNIIVKGNWRVSGITNPVPMSMHLEAVNIGRSAGINVQVDVTFLYNNQVLKTQKVYFGTINNGATISKDEMAMVTFPVDPTTANPKLIEMKISKITIDGKDTIAYIPS